MLASWEPLKSYFLAQGSDECTRAIWNVIEDQEHEMAPSDEPTFSELYRYLVHFFMSSFQDTLLKLETQSTTSFDLYSIMYKFRSTLKSRQQEQFFGMKAKLALRKNYLPETSRKKFTADCLLVYQRAIAYLEKWFDFDGSPYRAFVSLGLGNIDIAPTLTKYWTYGQLFAATFRRTVFTMK